MKQHTAPTNQHHLYESNNVNHRTVQGVDLRVTTPIETVNLTNPFTTFPIRGGADRQDATIESVDFNPNSGMFDVANDERKQANKSESDDLERQSSSEDFEQFVLDKTPEKKPEKPDVEILSES